MAEDFDHGHFYRLGEDFMRGAIRVRPAASLFSAAVGLTRGEESRTTPGRFTHDEGTRARDIVGTTYATFVLVSDRVVGALDGFSGWSTYPVELSGRDGEPLPGYHGLSVTGRAGAVDDALSPRRMLPPPVPEGNEVPGRLGLLFPPDSWDGSDVFLLGDSTLTVVVEPVRDALVAAGVKNVRLERVTEIGR